jgi:hypothetical protein
MTTYTPKEWKKILTFSEENGVAAACKEFSVGKTTFYEKKKKFKDGKLAGLEPIQRKPGRHPASTPDNVVKKIETFALKHSWWSAQKIVDCLSKRESGIPTAVTVRKIIKKYRLGRSRVEDEIWNSVHKSNKLKPIPRISKTQQILNANR